MKKTRKIISLLLAVLMVLTMLPFAMISASAAEQKIYFEVPEDWTGYTNVYCHIWPHGEDPLANWMSKKEKCTLEEDGSYSYDISKVGGITEGVTYCVIFSADTNAQTYDAFMGIDCLGDTLYCDDTIYENPVDSVKTVRAAFWKNQDSSVYGPVMQITSIGNLVGTCLAPGETPETLFLTFLTNNLESARTYSGKNDQQIIDDIITALELSEDVATEIILDTGIYVDWNDIYDVPPSDDKGFVNGDYAYTVYSGTYAAITGYTGSDSDLTLPETLGGYPVTAVEFYAFDSCTSLVNLTVPGNIKNIYDSAFSSCVNLETVTLLEGVECIDYNAFEMCSSLKSVTVPASVCEIYPAFAGCYSLEEITVDENNPLYESVDGILFSKEQSSLIVYPAGKTDAAYTVPATVGEIAPQAFIENSYIESVTLPEGITFIPDLCFTDCSALKNITLPEGITFIETYAFWGCVSLETVTLPQSLEAIYDGAFSNCIELTSITIPKNIEYLGYSVFGGCDSLESIKVENGNREYKDIDGVLYTMDMKTLVKYPEAKKGSSYTVPSGVKTLEYDSFLNALSLTEIILPKSIADIYSSNLGYYSNIVDRYMELIPVENFTIHGYTNTVADIYAQEYGFNFVSLGTAEYDPSYLIYYIYNDSFIEISDLGGRFDHVVIPEVLDGGTVTDIDSWSLIDSCDKSITIPKTVAYIGSEAFGYTIDPETWTPVKIEDFIIYGYKNSVAEEYAIENGFDFVAIGIQDYDPSFLYYYIDDEDYSVHITGVSGNFAHLEIPSEIYGLPVVAIEDYAFNYKTLMSITVPESVTYIGLEAFGYYDDYEMEDTFSNAGFTVFGYADSAAYEYASSNGFTFVDLSDSNNSVTDSAPGITATGYGIQSVDVNEISETETLPGKDELQSYGKNIQTAYDINIAMDGGVIARVEIPWGNKNANVYSLDPEGNVVSMNSIYENGTLVFCTGTSGTYIVASNSVLSGDANDDGTVNIKDATAIQKFLAKQTVLSSNGEAAADVTGDGTINIKDATAIQKFVAKIDTGFNIGEPVS